MGVLILPTVLPSKTADLLSREQASRAFGDPNFSHDLVVFL